jgi:DNA-binding NarL/FixJ family response regulator
MERTRLLLADGHNLILEAITKLLEPEFNIVGTATDGLALLKKASELKPEIVILDLDMPRLNGMDAGAQLKSILPQTKIIVLTASEDFQFAAQALRSWASGYLLKRSSASELERAIHSALMSKTYVTPSVARRLWEEFTRTGRRNHETHMTKRQKQVLQLLAEGHPMKTVGAMLEISSRTVAFHKYRMMEEHGLRTNSDIVMFAIKQRVLAAPV